MSQQDSSGPPKAVRLSQWQKQMGRGVPALKAHVSCAVCLGQVRVNQESWMLPRLSHSDAVVVCDGCARSHLPAEAAPEASKIEPDLWSSAGTSAAVEDRSLVPSEPSLAVEMTLRGMLAIDADMQGSLRIETVQDVSRILQRLHQAVTAAEFLSATFRGPRPTLLLTNTLGFIMGLDAHCLLVQMQRDLEPPTTGENVRSEEPAKERAEEKSS